MNSRQEILALLAGQRLARVPSFSGLIHVTSTGLDSLGLRLSEIHTDPVKMANAAATSYELCGLESAVVPTDLCVEASVLGAEVDFRADMDEPMFPIIARPLAANAEDLWLPPLHNVTSHPRLAVVVEAIRLLKEQVGSEIVVGAWIPGPLTLALQVVELNNLYADIKREPRAVARVLDELTPVLIEAGSAYRAAGADFLTIHEMGGSPGVIGPRAFEQLVLPRLRLLIQGLPAPRVLSVCGKTGRAMELLVQAGAEALSVDQTNDVARSRAIIGDKVMLFGNVDPVAVLVEGDTGAVRHAVVRAIRGGVDAVWPGCDLPPRVPCENLRALAGQKETSGA